MGTGRIHLDVPKVLRTPNEEGAHASLEEEKQVNNNVDHSAGCAHVDAHIMRTCDVSQMVCAFGDATGTGRAHLDDPKECA